ncbi:hypothetical protein ABIB25_000949 [Nakamurella sp. UYEF19]|uniref:hypothetical protein n=1 Tax=Nakamurella sp. UYEF19 TaxID=1756392 RepID=UPI00339B87DC
MSDWSRRRFGLRSALTVVGVLVVAAVLVFIGRVTAPASGVAGAAAASAGTGAGSVPPYQQGVPTGSVARPQLRSVTPDGGGGWTAPPVGAGHGPRAVSAQGVPSGYTQDSAGAAVAAANAVIGGLWFNTTMSDPWSEMGFLAADPAKAQGNAELTALITAGQSQVAWLLGPQYVEVLSNTAGTAAPPSTFNAGTFGGAVLGVRVTMDSSGGVPTAAAQVLWEQTGYIGASQPGTTVAVVTVTLVWQGDWKVAGFDRASLVGKQIGSALTTLPAPGWLL